jgi:hypothetical protein
MVQTEVQLPLETVAAIMAAVAAYLDQPLENFVIRRVTPEPAAQGLAPQSVWAKAGVLEAHLTRRQFGLRTR